MRVPSAIALFTCSSALLATAATSFAQDPLPPPPPAPPPSAYPTQPAAYPPPPPPAYAPPAAPVDDEGEDPDFKRFTLTANPLSILVGRYSGNFEFMLARHHGLIVVPSYWGLGAETSVGPEKVESSFRYLGGELGYHFYSGNRGANGFFIGPSAVFMTMKVSDKVTSSAGNHEDSASTSLYGFAIDVGGQHVAKNGFTVGGGFGFMYLKMKASTEGRSEPWIDVSGVLPRALFMIGYSF